jgi:alkaline phosphatase D
MMRSDELMNPVHPARLRAAVRHEGQISRRLFLAYGAALSAVPLLTERVNALATLQQRPTFSADPFSLGVASGEPDHTGFVLWTRLAPRPLDPDGGMGADTVPVRWEVAEDEAMTKVVKSGAATAAPLLGHSVHVEVDGLRPDRWYWYRFQAGDAVSPVGRTRTLPEPNARPERLRFAFASCQHWEAGLYTAYEQMARDDLDLVFFLGDYIYEGAGRDNPLRKHAGPRLTTLTDYRVRYSQYRTDPLLRAVHARFPWFVTWDDHEVENDYAGENSWRSGRNGAEVIDQAEFLLQRAAAYQAYYEMMPLRRTSVPRGPDMRLYRKASYGRLAELLLLDTRQYRSTQPNNDQFSDLNAAALDPHNTLLGAKQRDWLKTALAASPGAWNVLAQQVMMGMVDRTPGGERQYSMDQWPGYAHERMELVKFLGSRKVSNPVVLTGDIHTHWANDLRVDDRKMNTRVVATEFVGSSITSGGDGTPAPKNRETLLAENPFVRYYSAQRGYVRCTVTPSVWRSDFVVVDKVTAPGGKISTGASFQVESGRPGARAV